MVRAYPRSLIRLHCPDVQAERLQCSTCHFVNLPVSWIHYTGTPSRPDVDNFESQLVDRAMSNLPNVLSEVFHIQKGHASDIQALQQVVQETKVIELPRDKTNNVAVRPAKTQISLGIRPV